MQKKIFSIFSIFFLFSSVSFADPSVNNQIINQESLEADHSIAAEEDLLSAPEPETNLAPTASPYSDEAPTKIIKAIDVEGNKTIGISVILSKIKIRVGQAYQQNIISDDLKRLYNTGYFSDVSVDRQEYQEGFKVIISLKEKPIVEEITFSKIRYLKPRSLQNKMKTKEGKFLDNKNLKDDVKTIQELYAKKGLTTAKVDVESFVDEVTNKASLHFVIQEGRRVQIKRINIVGNRAFKDKRIIKAIKTRADSLFTSGFLKEEILQEDMERITSFYEQEGYIDAKASYVLDYQTKGRLTLDINIEEGKRYFVGNINIKGNSILSEHEIYDGMKDIKVGNIFSREKLEKDIADVRTLYFDKGYIFADVKESTSLNPQSGKVEVRLDVKEGNLAYVEQVKIQGNTRTRDIVVRREIKLTPGDQFDGAKLRRSKERLRNLGYFEDVGYDVEDTQYPDRKNLIVQVKEAKTGSLSFGGGYSTIDQVVGFVEVEQKNFDFTNWPTFTGGGQNLQVRAETGSLRNNARLSFTEPWLFDYPVSGGFDVYRTERARERDVGYAYDERRAGGDLRLGKQFTDYVTGGLNYRRENIKIGNLDDDVSADLAAEEGENLLSSVGFSLTRDSRDSIFNPTKGLLLTGTVDVAGGPFAGDKDFVRFQDKVSYNIPFKYGSVLELSVRTGFSDSYGDSNTVPIFERFFAGGAKSIRGYNERKVGPIDPLSEDPIGGESLLITNIEYTVPVIEYIKLATFFDAGNVWSKISDFGTSGIKKGAGIGLRVKTPIGPINLDYGYPLDDEPGEDQRSGKFYFSVSRGF